MDYGLLRHVRHRGIDIHLDSISRWARCHRDIHSDITKLGSHRAMTAPTLGGRPLEDQPSDTPTLFGQRRWSPVARAPGKPDNSHAASADANPPVRVKTGDPAPESLRGKPRLVPKVNEEVVGELPMNRVSIKEDAALARGLKHRAVYGADSTELDEVKEIFVRTVPPEDQDWMPKSATLLSPDINNALA
ncbi:uncharacterized protein BXZ73DRAFT_110172 [Epithele typhae]|uniref:uncharacterized protein n=1 Tax=Epithele typhae TaxID=378194 RepID=UPI002008E8E1|nr:uncharacterized protein BXZ73DRAFT_110172 [Epithele typhae]KAH9907669.1 hypothetical protein BXZ73DRAFT_110172 [Epithele typhae]